MRKVYELKKDDKAILTVSCATPDWLPLKPKLSRPWLRRVVADALERTLPDVIQPRLNRRNQPKKSLVSRVLRRA